MRFETKTGTASRTLKKRRRKAVNMKVISQATIQPNTGWTGTVKKGQRTRVSGVNIVDFVVFNHDNLRERLDASRTRGNQGKLFITTGDSLISKFNRPMMKIVEDTYTEGTHDLEKGMCSGSSYRRKGKLGRMGEYPRPIREVPDHGCWENLAHVLKPFDILPEDLPSPFNIFMTMEIDGKTGRLGNTTIRPSKTAHVDLEAEMNCLIGISVCPDLMVEAKPVDVVIYDT
jgi:uncharacterized protein